jgi:uncharacterized protein with gpF-like domain
MAVLKYIGGSHFRELLKEDFAKVGVEVEEGITFARHELVKVSDEVADAIHQLVDDEFEEVKEDVKDEMVRDAAEDPQPANVTAGSYVPQRTVEPATTDAPNDATPADQENWVTKEEAPQTGSPAQVEGPQ